MSAILRDIKSGSLLDTLLSPPSEIPFQPPPLPYLDDQQWYANDHQQSNVTLISGPPFSGKSRLLAHSCTRLLCSDESTSGGGVVVVIDLDDRLDELLEAELASVGIEGEYCRSVLLLKPESEIGFKESLARLLDTRLFDVLDGHTLNGSLSGGIFDEENVAFKFYIGRTQSSKQQDLCSVPLRGIIIDGLSQYYWPHAATSAGSWQAFASSVVDDMRVIATMFGGIPAIVSATSFSTAMVDTASGVSPVTLGETVWPVVPGAATCAVCERVSIKQRMREPSSPAEDGRESLNEDEEWARRSMFRVHVGLANKTLRRSAFTMVISDATGVRFLE
ncbi:uncharacterized protein V1518DRAFT_402688 [Limtongia smithiae]|uniref:uncharacterized protein n=1 Tax=Limtongia smithiae TaxID=1125753 RepID=UPI0034CFF474